MASKMSSENSGDTINAKIGNNATSVNVGKDIHSSGNTNVAGGNITQANDNQVTANPSSVEAAAQKLGEQARAYSNQLDEALKNYHEVREQAKQASIFSMIAASVGFLLVAVAVVLFYMNAVSAAGVTVALSALSQAFAAFFAGQTKGANARLDVYHEQLVISERKRAAIGVVESMESSPAKERMIGKLLDNLLQER
ncbi:MAG: hypothetical protein U0X20_20380 [Caldilineaceae bacterium]